MTNASTEHPYGIPSLELTAKDRRISFEKNCLENITVLRNADDGEWKTLIERARPPFTDEEDFPKGTNLSYAIVLSIDGKIKRYEMTARLKGQRQSKLAKATL